jgi:hypothetical protein
VRNREYPIVEVGIELGGGLQSMLNAVDRQALERHIAIGLSAQMTELGIPGRPIATLAVGSSRRLVGIRVDGTLRPFPPQRLVNAWLCTGRQIGAGDWAEQAMEAAVREATVQTGADGGFPDRWLTLAASTVAQRPNQRNGHFLTSLLVRLCLDVITGSPECLLGSKGVEVYAFPLQGRASDQHRREELRLVLTSLLSLGISLIDKAVVLEEIETGWASNRGAEDTVELLFTKLRSESIEVITRGCSTLQEHRAESSLFSDAGLGRELRTLQELEQLLASRSSQLLPPVNWVVNRQLPPGVLTLRVNHAQGPWCPAFGAAEVLGVLFAELSATSYRLLGIEDAEYLLAFLDQSYWAPALIPSFLAKWSLGDLARLLRSFLRERQPIRDLPGILDRAARFDVVELDSTAFRVFDDRFPVSPVGRHPTTKSSDLSQFVRTASKGAMVWAATGGVPTLNVLVIGPYWERRVFATFGLAASKVKPLTEAEQEAFRDSVWNFLPRVGGVPPGTAILTSTPARACVRAFLAPEFPELPVIADSEVGPNLRITENQLIVSD